MMKKATMGTKPTKMQQAKQVLTQRRQSPSVNTKNMTEFRSTTIQQAQKYKYPFQQVKHKVLFFAGVAVVVALVLFVALSYYALYVRQNTSDFYYTAMKVVPIPVASVDGQKVAYSDYLRRVRASTQYIERQEERDFSTEDGQRELNYIKRASMDEAQRSAFAMKIAREKKLTVGSAAVNDELQRNLRSASGATLSERAFEASIRNYYGWDLSDYRRAIYERLVLQEAMFQVDDRAEAKAQEIMQNLSANASVDNFVVLAKEQSEDEETKESGGEVGWISANDVDNDGLIAAAKALEKDQISGIIRGLDAYYIIQLIEKNDVSVSFRKIKIALTEFNAQFDALRERGKIYEYITIKSDE
jgi:parvulin-like peptidyl-prolyl isomerase